jgi:hypothetical protein
MGESKNFNSHVYIRTYSVKLVLYLYLSILLLHYKSFKSLYIFIRANKLFNRYHS